MEKRIAALSSDPHTVSLTDRKCSLFIDPRSGSIFVDEGDGEGRMNGAVFSPGNSPSFSILPAKGPDRRLVLDYRGIQYMVGVSQDRDGLRRWARSANLLLSAKGKRAGDDDREVPKEENRKEDGESKSSNPTPAGNANASTLTKAASKESAQDRARPGNGKQKRKGKRKK